MNDNSLKQGEEKVWRKRYTRKVVPVLCIAFLMHILAHTYVFGSWGTNTVDSVVGVGKYSSIGVGTSGAVYISYYDNTNRDLKYATNVSGSWVTSTVDSVADVGKYSSIGVGTSGAVYISYYDDTNCDLKYATNVSGLWVTSTVDSVADVGEYSSIDVGTSGAVYISYYDDTNGDLKYATNVSGSWATSAVDSVADVGKYSSIGVGTSGAVYISYYDDTNGDLKYATNVSGSWVTSAVDSVADVGEYSSIGVGTSGAVYISYYDNTNGDLKYATNVSGSWVTSAVDSGVDVGKYSSIGVGTSGAVYISYYDDTNSDLKYATNVSGSWVTSAVDSVVDVGEYSSIGVGTSGAVCISYYDDTNGDLRYIVAPAPVATTGSVSGITTIAATLGGTVNANNGYATSAYYQYGATSGSYSGTSTTQSVSGTTNMAVNIGISGLTAATNYYYRIVAQGNGVMTYGSEASFTTSSSGGGEGGEEPVKEKLTINSTSPTNGATGISVNTTVSANLSMYVNGSTVTTDTFTVSSENGKAAGVVSVNGATVTFTSSGTLDYNTTYTAIITTRVQAANWAGTTMESDYSWSFTTVSAPTTPTPSPSPVISPSITPEVTPKATPVTTITPTPLPTVTATPTPTPIPGPSPLPTVSPEPLPSPSPIVKTRVYGYVYDAEGNPIDNISVNMVHNELSGSIETNSEGYYEFRVHDTGICTLTYEKGSYETSNVTITIVNEAEVKVEDITMESAAPTGMIYGYTVDSGSNDVGFVKLRFKGVNTKASETTTSDADGFFECGKLESDTYEITAAKKGFNKTKLKISIREGEENETEIVLKKKIKK